MRGKADVAGGTAREQLLVLAQRCGQAHKTLSLFIIEVSTALQNVGGRMTSPLTLALLNAAIERRRPSWTQAISAERECKRQRVSNSQKRDVVFAAKMAQSVVKAYASVDAAADKEEELKDVVTAMDLACVALYVTCALEHEARLGEFVVDNLLYQVAKKYAGIPNMHEAASCVAACVHVRLWNNHVKMYKEDTTDNSQLMALLSHDQVNTKLVNTVTQKLELLAEFPRPKSCHTAQFSRLLLGHTNTCITLLTAAKCHEGTLLVAETTLSPWIEHLHNLPGDNLKLSSSFSDRAFRILWKCAASKDGAEPESASTALRFRSTALAFLLKCSNYTSSYYIQQVHRIGVQHERASRRSQRGLQELYMFYSRSANSLTRAVPVKTHIYSSAVLQLEYIHWLEHFATICEISGMHIKSAMIMKSAIQYVQTFNGMGEAMQPCLLFAVTGALFSAAGSEKQEKWLSSRTESSQSHFDKRLDYNAGRVIGDLVRCVSSSTWFDHCEKAARMYLKKLEGLPCKFGSLTPKDIPFFVPFLTRCLKRGSTKVLNYAVSVEHSSKYQLYKQIIRSFDELSKAIQELRGGSIIKDRKMRELLLLEESRLHRMAVTLLVRCCSEDRSIVGQPGLQDLSYHVNLFRVLLDEATINGKPSESILQGVFGDLNAIARECYNCATRCYKTGNYHDTISALIGAFELAESYLEYVMCSNLAAEDILKAHAQLKVDAIVSLLAYCFHQLEDYTKSRIYTGYSILYCGDINEKIPEASVDKFVSCILEEVSLLGNQTELSLERELKMFLDTTAHVFKARSIPVDQVVMLWNVFRVAFERFSLNIVTRMRARASTSGMVNSDEICVRLCCSLESYVDGMLMELKQMPVGCESLNEILLEVSLSLAKRKQVFCGVYANSNYSDGVQGLLLVRRSLTDAGEKLQLLSDFSTDLGGIYGWRGIVTMEIILMNCYAGAKGESRIEGDASICEERAIADIERCLMFWNEYGEKYGFLFHASRVICCLEAICSTLSLISCSVMEKAARKILQAVHSSLSATNMGVVPPVLLSLLYVNEEENVMITKSSDTKRSIEAWPFKQIDDDICAARSAFFGNNGPEACQHLLSAITNLGDLKDRMKQRPPASVAKALGVRELFIHSIVSDIYFREGRSTCAIIEAKAALRICWKLLRKFGVNLQSTEQSHFELPVEFFSSGEYQENSKQNLFFEALESSSWDLLSAAKVLLCRVASLYTLSDQPRRASFYLTEAMRLVGGLDLRLFPRKPFYEFAELELNLRHVKKAKMAISLLTPCSAQDNTDIPIIDANAFKQHSCKFDFAFIEQKCNEIVQQGDVNRTEGHHQVALSCYLEAIKVLSAVAHTEDSSFNALTRVKARCWRKTTGLQCQTTDFTDPAAVEELLTSMKTLKRSMKTCDSRLERIKDMLELGRSNIKLLRSTSPRAFTSLERTITLLEDAFALGDCLDIPHLSQELRTALGMAYFAEIEHNASDETECMEGTDRDRFLSWASSSLLASAGSIDAVEMEFVAAETDSKLSTKEALVMQLERLSSASSSSREQIPHKLLNEIVHTVSEKVRQLPASWVIISLMINFQSELVISRIPTNGAAPISFCLPKVDWMKCMRAMDVIISESRELLSGNTAQEAGSMSTTQKKEWWNTRKVLDERIEKAVFCMQETLGFWRCLLVKKTNSNDEQMTQNCWNILTSNKKGPIKLAERNQALLSALSDAHQWLSDREVLDTLNHIAAEIKVPMSDSTAQKLLQILRSTSTETSNSCHASNLVKLSTETITKLTVSDVKQLLATEGLRTDGLKKVLVERLLEARDAALSSKLAFQACKDSRQCSTILILNHSLQQFPWEALDVMGSSSGVTRMPSLDLILKNANQASLVNCVRRSHVRFLLNPAGDLKSTQNQLGPILKRGMEAFGWEGVVGEVPDPDELREYLLAADLYIYCGHGSGEMYLHRDKVLTLQPNCSAALLFGCSSGRLEREGIFGPSGAVLAYLRAGSPTVLAMLWDVTDRDIDQLSTKVLEEWLLTDHKESRSLAEVLQDSRDVCKLKYLNGHAAVCYGLPLYVTPS